MAISDGHPRSRWRNVTTTVCTSGTSKTCSAPIWYNLHPPPKTTPYYLHPTPYTLCPTPHTPHPTLYARFFRPNCYTLLHVPASHTLLPTSYTPHPTAHTLHPEPKTKSGPYTPTSNPKIHAARGIPRGAFSRGQRRELRNGRELLWIKRQGGKVPLEPPAPSFRFWLN